MALTKATYSMIAGAPTLVDDFIPAGVDPAATDVSSYIQNAINSLPTANTGVRGHLAFSNKRYNLGTPMSGDAPKVFVDRPMLISGNGATLFVAGAATGRVWRVNAPFVTMQDFVFTKTTFSLVTTADLTGEALSMYADTTRPCQKWQLINIEITGFEYGMVFFGDTAAGCSYGDVYSPRIRFTAKGMVFDEADVLNAYCTNINVFGGELSLDGFGAYTNSVGIDIRNTTSFTVTNGINFYGTNIEGSWVRKVRCEGQQCSFNNMYWDDTNGGTDIEFVNSPTQAIQKSKNNIIVGGSPLHIQVVANTSGEINSLIDPNKGIGFGNPVLTSTTAFQFTQASGGGGAVFGIIANSGAPLANNNGSLRLQAKKADGTLVDMGTIAGSTVDPTGEGSGLLRLFARNPGGFGYPVAECSGADGNFFPGLDDVASCGKSGNRWSAIWATNGTIQTSDPRTKTEIKDSVLGLDFINKLRPVSYKFKVGGNKVLGEVVEEAVYDLDGNLVSEAVIKPVVHPVAGKRQHFGLLTTNVKEALGDIDFGGYIKTNINDLNSEEALRYDQFISPLIKAVQELSEKVNKLETRAGSDNQI